LKQPHTTVTLLVGGAGFIGQALAHKLLASGHRQVLLMGRSTPPTHLPSGASYIQGDAADAVLMGSVLDGVDEVVDLAYATVPKTSFENPLFDVVSNLPSSVNLLQVASRKSLRKYLLVSSGGTVYGQAQTAMICETHPTDPISPYGISKLLTEKYATFFRQMEQLPVITARPANPFGAMQVGKTAQGFIGAAIAAIRRRQAVMVYGARGTVRDYIYIDDLASALAAMLDSGQVGCTYNVGTGIGTDNMNVLAHLQPLAAQDGLPLEVSHLEERRFDVRSNVLDSHMLREHTGWHPSVDLAEGLSRVWNETRSD
jgi:UDP-glucose 4-epimerase